MAAAAETRPVDGVPAGRHLMPAANKQRADQAQQMARGADALRRRACLVVSVALSTTSSVAGARRVLEDVEPRDVKAAAIALLEELAREKSTA